MPSAIIFYEIDKSFGPNILAEYYLKDGDKIPTTILKDFVEKHIKKELEYVTIRKDNKRYYSSILKAESIEKENLYLSFILQEGEVLLSLKSIFNSIEEKIILDFTTDKKKMTASLKKALNSILSSIQKLQEPKIIKEILNERTKKMLDDGLLQEARELIDLGEEVPEKLAEEVNLAEELLNEGLYRKAKKGFLKASELAALIQEEEIASFLESKGNQVGTFPELLKERENLNKELEKISNKFEDNDLYLYNFLIEPIDRLIEISNNFEEEELIDDLSKLKNIAQRATRVAKELYGLEQKFKEQLKNL
ncbi:hypothetical protein LCGC14_1083570 [marine sediment metagenome]|uniref:Uncharacterized protein n=1 Tax=marine sediment metagenome TaxID=412755 RepID=A0A0F9N275_9ZZZZ